MEYSFFFSFFFDQQNSGSSGCAILQIWDWKEEIMLASAKAHANPVTMCRFNPYQSHDADEVLEDSRCYTLVTGKSFVSCSRFFSIKFFSDISEDDFFESKNFFDTVWNIIFLFFDIFLFFGSLFSLFYQLHQGGLRHVKLWVLKKTEHPMDIEERYKEKGKKVSKPFGGASR